jgi:hypothetical protein
MECFHAWARGAIQWVKRCNVAEPMYGFFKQLSREAEDAIELAVTEVKLPPAPVVQGLGDFSDEVSDIVSDLLNLWPKKNPRGTPVGTEVGLLAGRVDWILRTVPGVDGKLLLDAARVYLETKRARFQTAQYFFSADHSAGEAPWKAYAKIVRYNQRTEEPKDPFEPEQH